MANVKISELPAASAMTAAAQIPAVISGVTDFVTGTQIATFVRTQVVPISLATEVTGNLAVSHLNSGTNADSSHYWRGDGTWATITFPAASLTIDSTTIASGTTTRLLYDNGATVGETAAVTYITATPALNLSSSAVLSFNADAGITRAGASALTVGNGTAGDGSGTLNAAILFATTIRAGSGGVVAFSDGSDFNMALSRSGSTLLVGTGAAGSFAGTVKATLQTGTNATTGLVAGALAATTNASIVITDASGQVYRVPCII